MHKVAIVTEKELPHLSDDDSLLINPLKKMGITVVPAIWDDPKVEWTGFSAVILRSCWHYYEKINEFRIWLDHLFRANVNLWNPYQTVKWNIDKTYLFDLKKLGINIVPTFYPAHSKEIDSTEIIMKPRFGSSGYKVRKIKKEDLYNLSENFLIQPYVGEIEKTGELSIIFINNNFSHAVRKLPKKGDFLTGYAPGVKWTRENLRKDHLNQATAIYELLKTDLLFARIDVVEVQTGLQLMELELTEPFLYFAWDKSAIRKFCNGLVSRIL